MQVWQNRKIFGLAKQLQLNINDLRDMAAEINNGKRSLSSLNVTQAGELLNHLYGKAGIPPVLRTSPLNKGGGMVKGHEEKRPDGKPWDYQKNNGKWSRLDLLFDYMLKVGWTIWEMRAWLDRYFHINNENWLDNHSLNKAIEGLKAMYKRQPADE